MRRILIIAAMVALTASTALAEDAPSSDRGPNFPTPERGPAYPTIPSNPAPAPSFGAQLPEQRNWSQQEQPEGQKSYPEDRYEQRAQPER
jgi:hypothetical protein